MPFLSKNLNFLTKIFNRICFDIKTNVLDFERELFYGFFKTIIKENDFLN